MTWRVPALPGPWREFAPWLEEICFFTIDKDQPGRTRDQRIPNVLHPLLQSFTRQAEQEIPGRITAFYLEGYITLDAFCLRMSDIDFIAVAVI